MATINIITLFPELFREHINTYPVRKAVENDILNINLINLRDFAVDARGSVDDKTYGGGVGMVIRPEPIFEAVESIPEAHRGNIVLLSPKGQKFTQKKAKNLSKSLASNKNLTFICGRYEGIDARVQENLADETISIGDFVLSGGEVGAMVIIESVTRLLPGILEKEGASEVESFENGLLEYPQYTRPEEYKGMKVPEVLLSGNHAEIKRWREKHSKSMNSQDS